MRRTGAKSESPLSMRISARDIDLIDRAARIRGRSRTEFVRDAAVQAAEGVVLERTVVQMSAEGFAAFAKAIAGPGRAVNALAKVLRRKAPWA